MRRLIYCALALAAGLFATSCQQENLEPVQEGNTVTFTVKIPEVATKAMGNDVSNINNLVYAVYRTDATDEATAIANLDKSQLLYQVNPKAEGYPTTFVGGATNITLELINDQRYVVLFWAQVSQMWVAGKDFDLTNISYPKQPLAGNDNKYAAFSGVAFVNKVKGSRNESVTLHRPFAQINIATLDPTNYNVEIESTAVKVYAAGSAFNVATQTAVANSDVEYSATAMPADESLTVGGVEYNTLVQNVVGQPDKHHYIASNYVFANSNVEVEYTINTKAHGTVVNKITNVPVKANYRTNIVGNLLTSDVDYNVTLDQTWGDNGADMEVITDGIVKNINGDYEITTAGGFAHAINELFADGGTFYIHPGSYNFTGIKVEPKATKTGAILNVKANAVPVVTRTPVVFEITGLDVRYLVSKVVDGSQAIFSGLVLPEYTQLVGENKGIVAVANCSNGNNKSGVDLIADNTGTYVDVTPEVMNRDGIQNALNQGLGLIELCNDIESDENIVFTITQPVIFDGCGHTLTANVTSGITNARAINVSGANGVTIKNLNIVAAGERAINIIQNATNVNIENVTAEAYNYVVNVAGSAENSKVSIKNSDLTGKNTISIGGANSQITISDTKLTTVDNADEGYSTIAINTTGVNASVVVNGGEIVITGDKCEGSIAGNITADDASIILNNVLGNNDIKAPYFGVGEGNYYYSFETFADALDYLTENPGAAGTIKLLRHLSINTPITIPENTTVVLDLNGKTLIGTMHKTVGHVINNKGNLTIKNGTVSSTANNGGSAVMNSGTTVIIGVTLNGAPNADGSWPSYAVNNKGTMTVTDSKVTSYHGGIACYEENAVVTLNNSELDMVGIAGFTSHGIYTYDSGKVVVNGGTYANKATDQNSSGASVINGAVTVNDGTFSGRIENYYGTPVLNGGSFTVNPKSFIAEGCFVHENENGTYEVYNGTAVHTVTELKAATKVDNATIYVYPCTENEDGVYLLHGTLSLAEGVKLIGVGDEPVPVFNDWGSNAFGNQAHFTNTYVENISFTNNLIIDAGIANGNVRFKNCVFGGDLAHQGVHFDSGKGIVVFDNCTFIGRNMLGSSLEKVIFNNCTFLNKKTSLTDADKWTGVNMWGTYEFNNCVFDTEAHCNVKCNGVVADFNECSYVDNIKDIATLINNSGYEATIRFNGK